MGTRKTRLTPAHWLVLGIGIVVGSCGTSGGKADSGVDAGPWGTGPVAPPAVACGGDIWCEGTCCHTCVAPSCEGGWCRIPAGCFIYGSPPEEPGHGLYTEIETPVELLQDFVIQQHELTRAQWADLGLPMPAQGPFCGDNIGDPCLAADCPVDAVNWWEGLEAANRLSRKHGLAECYQLLGCQGQPGQGMECESVQWPYSSIYECPGYRLPTFVEHEYAVRAGTRTAYYSGDMEPIPLEDGLGYHYDANLDRIAWYVWNSGNTSHPVGGKEPNGWMLHDMSGNVMEWLWDRQSGLGFHGQYQTNPVDWQTTDERHVKSSGSFWAPTVFCRSASHYEGAVGNSCFGIGLRFVRTVTWPEGTDTDTDEWVDTDTESDACDVEPGPHDPDDCPLNSGWPCSCDREWGLTPADSPRCDDDSACVRVDATGCMTWGFGVCAAMCSTPEGSLECPEAPAFTAEPWCLVSDPATYPAKGCVLQCLTDSDCPSDQSCQACGSQDEPGNCCYPLP